MARAAMRLKTTGKEWKIDPITRKDEKVRSQEQEVQLFCAVYKGILWSVPAIGWSVGTPSNVIFLCNALSAHG